MLSDVGVALKYRLKQQGVTNPIWTVRAARTAGLSLPLALAFLSQESFGLDKHGKARVGLNVYGHDGVSNPIKSGKLLLYVTKQNYFVYKHFRSKGEGSQGVGPMQLTYSGYQDAADRLGGCWNTYYNMLVGFSAVGALIKQYGRRDGIRRYNGSGPAAVHYANEVLRLKYDYWLPRLKGYVL